MNRASLQSLEVIVIAGCVRRAVVACSARGSIRRWPTLQLDRGHRRYACEEDYRPTYTKVIGFLHKYVRLELLAPDGRDCRPKHWSNPLCSKPGAGPIGLDPGQAAIIYFTLNNGTVSSVDGGAQTSVSVFAGKTGAPQSIAIGSKI